MFPVPRTCKNAEGHRKKRDLPYCLRLCPIQNLSPDKGPGYDQVLPGRESLIQLWPDEIIRDLYRGRPGTILLGDGFRQPDASEEFLLSTRQVSSTLSVVRATYKRRRPQKLVETDPYADGVAGCFEDNDLGVAQTHGGHSHLLSGLRKMDASLTQRGPVSAEPCKM